jgi:hypothetical protein
VLRTIMDISARAFSLADRPQRAIQVTSVRMKGDHLPVGYPTLRQCSRETTKFGGIPSEAPIAP